MNEMMVKTGPRNVHSFGYFIGDGKWRGPVHDDVGFFFYWSCVV